MYERKDLKPLEGEIGSIAKIPDEDIVGWERALREAGFEEGEIKEMLSNLNRNYQEMELDKAIKKFKKDYGLEEDLKPIFGPIGKSDKSVGLGPKIDVFEFENLNKK